MDMMTTYMLVILGWALGMIAMMFFKIAQITSTIMRKS